MSIRRWALILTALWMGLAAQVVLLVLIVSAALSPIPWVVRVDFNHDGEGPLELIIAVGIVVLTVVAIRSISREE